MIKEKTKCPFRTLPATLEQHSDFHRIIVVLMEWQSQHHRPAGEVAGGLGENAVETIQPQVYCWYKEAQVFTERRFKNSCIISSLFIIVVF